MLIVFSGLPGTGKTTIARLLAGRLKAVYLRIDSIEMKVHEAYPVAGDMGPVGYMVAYAVAEDNLRLGHAVIADAVNPVAASREAWRAVAHRRSTSLIEVEIVCSDAAEHRRRVEDRQSDIDGFVGPSWQDVQSRHYEPWPQPPLVIDTAAMSAEEACARICDRIADAGKDR
jgi:predicted kinase